MEKFNHLTFIQFTEPKTRINGIKRKRALFRCDCGSEKTYDFCAITSGHTKQCNNCAIAKRGESRKTHGLIKHTLYRKWQDMKKRCYNPNVDRYNCYGALGITVCDEWRDDFQAFYNWSIANGWEEGLTIERNDTAKNYCPENCCYITKAEQHFNRRDTCWVEWEGEKLSLAKLCVKLNLSHKYQVIWCHLAKGAVLKNLVHSYQTRNRYQSKWYSN